MYPTGEKKSIGYSCIKPDSGSHRRSFLPMPDLTELEAVEKYSDEMEQAVGRTLYDAEREFMWRGYGFDIDNPLALISGSR